MACDCYYFKAMCSSDYAIMITNKDIKETHRPGSTNKDVKEATHGSSSGKQDEEEEEDEEEDEDLLDARLDKEDVDWLLDNAPDFKAYQISEAFVLFTKAHNDIRETPCVYVQGPYNIEHEDYKVCFNIEDAPKGEDYTELFELARKFTPPGSKLSFAPGKYSFAASRSSMLEVKQLKRFDFGLIVGKGDEKETVGVNRAVFLCCFPHVETRFGDALMDTKLELPELNPQAVQKVLDTYSSRKKVKRPFCWNEKDVFQTVQRAFGKSMVEMASETTPTESSRLEHPAIADPRWLDASFLCGPQRKEIKVNRSVLASMNPVLHRILFGTDPIPVDPSKPIEWPDYDAQAVRQVFLALLHCGKTEFVVPMESVDSVKRLVEYLGETREALMLIYDTGIGVPTAVPLDFDLIVGSGDKKKTIGINKTVFLCCFPHFETRFGIALMDSKVELPKLEPWAVQWVLKTFSSREKVERYGSYGHVQNVQGVFGKSMIEMASEKTPNESSRMTHPALADPRWLDASFLCGPQREEIKVNRSVLASMNPVLHRILFGTDLIPVDPSKPIEWPDFDAQVVRQVFLALLHCGKKEFVVPLENVESTQLLLDFLGETREALMLYFDTPFKREYHQVTCTLHGGKYGDGLKFTLD